MIRAVIPDVVKNQAFEHTSLVTLSFSSRYIKGDFNQQTTGYRGLVFVRPRQSGSHLK